VVKSTVTTPTTAAGSILLPESYSLCLQGLQRHDAAAKALCTTAGANLLQKMERGASVKEMVQALSQLVDEIVKKQDMNEGLGLDSLFEEPVDSSKTEAATAATEIMDYDRVQEGKSVALTPTSDGGWELQGDMGSIDPAEHMKNGGVFAFVNHSGQLEICYSDEATKVKGLGQLKESVAEAFGSKYPVSEIQAKRVGSSLNERLDKQEVQAYRDSLVSQGVDTQDVDRLVGAKTKEIEQNGKNAVFGTFVATSQQQQVIYRETAASQGKVERASTQSEGKGLVSLFNMNLLNRPALASNKRSDDKGDQAREVGAVKGSSTKKETEQKGLEGARRFDEERQKERVKDDKIDQKRKQYIELEDK
jgi:hypothetical protein